MKVVSESKKTEIFFVAGCLAVVAILIGALVGLRDTLEGLTVLAIIGVILILGICVFVTDGRDIKRKSFGRWDR